MGEFLAWSDAVDVSNCPHDGPPRVVVTATFVVDDGTSKACNFDV